MNELLIAGIDEVGRGCLAGPVVAALVILDPANPVPGLADSKSLSAPRRTRLAAEIREKSLVWSLGRAEPSEIDRLNILQASLLAMVRAAQGGLPALTPVWIRVDGSHYPGIEFPGEAVVDGDRLFAEVSAASILAKVYRDNEMILLDRICPGYGFRNNKGYPTREHLESLRNRGTTRFHRQSFAPVKHISRYHPFR
ncbi:MAG: ribonuclease HII [Methylococcaceae bacterium]|nr:ribonuclease HII [Methylococcaceae bacterium]MCI0666709.1 ribonuclease HII [Methylococcaceae bacterium]MCI0732965.1 ribonuclease HII [Methylococcaceae bacterium]